MRENQVRALFWLVRGVVRDLSVEDVTFEVRPDGRRPEGCKRSRRGRRGL